MRRVTLIGGAGAPNFGDELIFKGWLLYLNKLPQKHKSITFFENKATVSFNLARSILGEGVTQNFVFSDLLARLAKEFGRQSFWENISVGFNFLESEASKPYRNDKHLIQLLESEIVHLHGGGYLSNAGARCGFILGLLAYIKRMTGCKLVATGIGFGPFDEPQNINSEAELAFESFEFFEVRDIKSLQFIKNIFPKANCYHGLDDCYMLPIDEIVSLSSRLRTLHISVTDAILSQSPDEFWQSVARFSQRFDRTTFWESHPWKDKTLFQALSANIPNMTYLDLPSLLNKRVEMGQNDFFLTARFHVHFVGARAGGQGRFFSKSSYYDIKHQSIADLGSPMRIIDFSEIPINERIGTNSISTRDTEFHKTKMITAHDIYDFT